MKMTDDRRMLWGVAIMIGILLIPIIAWPATDLTFEWDRNTEPDIAGYRLYQSNASKTYVYGHDNCKKEVLVTTIEHLNTLTLTNVQDGTWFWVLTAFDLDDNESDPSNEVSTTLDSISPGSPTGLDIIIKIVIKIQQ